MQSTSISTEADPHDIFLIEPDVVLASRADPAPPASVNSVLAPPIQPAPGLAEPPPLDTAPHAAANDDIQIPHDIHVLGERVSGEHVPGERPSRGRWAARAIFGFLFALVSAAAAEGWNHYGDAAQERAKAMIASWTPSALTPRPAETAGTAAPPDARAVADRESAQDTTAHGKAVQSTASNAATDSSASLAQDVASMGQQIAALKADIEQLKASQDQMAQQISRDVARPQRTSPAKPVQAVSVEQSLHAKVTAALSPRPVAPPLHKPRPAYAPAQTSAASQPTISAPMTTSQPAAAPLPYEPRAQIVDQAGGDPVMRPPMPLR